LTEPEFFVLRTRVIILGRRTRDIPAPVRRRRSRTCGLGTPAARPLSAAARWAESSGILSFERSNDHVLHLTFDQGTSGQDADLRPELPLALRW
jgi:hypothetical protein